MRKSIFIFVALVTLAGCKHKQVVRESEPYQAELAFYEMAGMGAAQAAQDLMKPAKCTCDDAGAWSSYECETAADTIITIQTRLPWHIAMSKHLAGLAEDPGPEPEIPPASDLCPGD